jgi:hypothetical protein
MIGRFFKIGSLALLGIVVILGTMSAQKGGGSVVTKDIPLKAIFTDGLKITNDHSGVSYAHQGTKPGQNDILISSQTGRLIFVVYGNSGRFVNLHLDDVLADPVPVENLPSECDCVPPYFIYPEIHQVVPTTYIIISTTFECQKITHEDNTGTWAELIPSSRDYLNFATMTKGQTAYVCGRGNTIQFRTTDDPTTTNYDESVDLFSLFQEPQFFTVTAGDWDGDTVMDWTVTPFAERYKAVAKVNNVPTLLDFPLGGVPRRMTSSAYRSCDHGTFFMPFELKLARLK